MGLMTSYGRIGNCYTGGSEALVEGVARQEWGFKGVIVTDYSYDNKFNEDYKVDRLEVEVR